MESTERFVCFSSSDTLAVVNGGAAAAGAAVAGTAWVTLDFGTTATETRPAADRRKKFVFHRVHVLRKTGASGTAHTALVADVTGSASTAWATKYQSAAVAAATRLNETSIDTPVYTDSSGKLFFTPGGDAADTFDYEVWFRVVQ